MPKRNPRFITISECAYEWWHYSYQPMELRAPKAIEPTKVVGRSRKRRTNKLYTPGRRVRGDVAV